MCSIRVIEPSAARSKLDGFRRIAGLTIERGLLVVDPVRGIHDRRDLVVTDRQRLPA
jgi:hypothetical protein